MTMKQSMKAISFAAMLGIAALSAQVAVGRIDWCEHAADLERCIGAGQLGRHLCIDRVVQFGGDGCRQRRWHVRG